MSYTLPYKSALYKWQRPNHLFFISLQGLYDKKKPFYGIYDKEKLALEAVVSTSTVPYLEGLKEYMELGYVPMEKSGSSASVTLEYGYDDWAIYHMAKKMGDREVADTYLKRAGAYKHLVDERLGFIRPKNAAGQMKEKFDVLDTHGQGFIEGNSWNYSFYVPQDVNGLKAFMGGDKRFIERLDSLFTMLAAT